MAGANASKYERLDLPSESSSVDPETTKKIPIDTENQTTKKKQEKSPPQKK
jgi:hypothetical protein